MHARTEDRTGGGELQVIARLLSGLIDLIQMGRIPVPGLLSPARRQAFRARSWEHAPSGTAPVWFHAASLGELEMLMPLIEDFESGQTGFCVSCFSESGVQGLEKLRGRALFTGLSPRDSEWEPAFRRCGTRVLVVSKYDLWPGAVIAAKKLGIRVVVVNAQARTSLQWISRLFLPEALPDLIFFSNLPSSLGPLKSWFPNARVESGSDPRYERVARRISRPPGDRVITWRQKIAALPGPVGIVGSAWSADLSELLANAERLPGSLVVVPHDLSPPHLDRLRNILESALPGRYLLVDEMGILVELYPVADWAFVGGGFHLGIHSTIEPAVAGLQVICGPRNADRFPEVAELVGAGILTVCPDSGSISEWLKREPWKKKRSVPFLEEKRRAYLRLLESCRAIR